MDQDRNYITNMPYFGMEQQNFDNYMGKMPPYMYGKCMNMNMENSMPYNNQFMPCMDNNMPNCYSRSDMFMNPYMMQKLEPLENMYGNTYNVLIVYIKKTINNIMMENMGMMPKSISKEKFNKHMNDTICEVMKKEDEIKKMISIERSETQETEDDDRGYCPFCRGMLKDTLTILLVTELLRGGCRSCY